MIQQKLAKTSSQFFLRVIVALCLFFVIVAGVNRVLHSNVLPIQTVKVKGMLQHTTPVQIQDIVQPLVQGKGFFSVNVKQIQQALKTLPWIHASVISRIWPQALSITLSEYKPIAIWNNLSVLTASGHVIIPSEKSLPKQLPVLLGTQAEQLLMMTYLEEMDKQLSVLKLKITQVQLNQDLQWIIKLSNGLIMYLGQDKVLAKIHQFVKIYPKIIGQRGADVAYVNMQYTNGLALKWKGR